MSRRRPGSRFHAALDKHRWARVRAAVLERDNWRCRACGGYGDECDHVTPLHKGGAAYDEGNLQCLCRTCHIAKTAADRGHAPDPDVLAWRSFLLETLQESV